MKSENSEGELFLGATVKEYLTVQNELEKKQGKKMKKGNNDEE